MNKTLCNECFRFVDSVYKLTNKPHYTLCEKHFEELKNSFPKLAKEFERFRYW